jgi:cell division protein FtsL
MTETLHSITSIPSPFNMIVLIVLISCAAGTVTSMVKELRKFASHRQEVSLKRDLVERGLSIDEIERVVAAGKTVA